MSECRDVATGGHPALAQNRDGFCGEVLLTDEVGMKGYAGSGTTRTGQSAIS